MKIKNPKGDNKNGQHEVGNESESKQPNQSPKVTMKVEKLNNDGCRETKKFSDNYDWFEREMVDIHTKTQNHYLGELLDHIADDELDFPDERAKGLLTQIYPLCEHMKDRVHRLEKKLAKAKKKSAQCYQDVFDHIAISSDVVLQVRQILAQPTDEELRRIYNLYEDIECLREIEMVFDWKRFPTLSDQVENLQAQKWTVIDLELGKLDGFGDLYSGCDHKSELHAIIHTECLHAVFFRKRIFGWEHTEEEEAA